MAGELIGSTRKKYNGKGPDDRRGMGEIILAGRNQGRRMFALCAELGVTEDTGRSYMKLALDARVPPTVDEFRRQQNDALDERLSSLQAQIDLLDVGLRSRDEEGNTPSATMVLALLAERRHTIVAMTRVEERRAKLNGLDMPVRVDATVTVQDGEDAELQQIIRESQAKAEREKGHQA